MIKKFTSIILIFVMLICISACETGTTTATPTQKPSSTPTEAPLETQYTATVQHTENDYFEITLSDNGSSSGTLQIAMVETGYETEGDIKTTFYYTLENNTDNPDIMHGVFSGLSVPNEIIAEIQREFKSVNDIKAFLRGEFPEISDAECEAIYDFTVNGGILTSSLFASCLMIFFPEEIEMSFSLEGTELNISQITQISSNAKQTYFVEDNAVYLFERYTNKDGAFIKTRSEEYYSDGTVKKNCYYAESGFLSTENYYDENGNETRYYTYYENGNVKQKTYYSENGLTLQKIYYDENGNILEVIDYDENGNEISDENEDELPDDESAAQ